MVGYDINNLDHITGNGSLANGRWAAFIWSRATGTIGIGNVPGASVTLARGLNDNDEVAGIGYIGATTTAFYWKRGIGIATMQTLGGVSGAAVDINLGGVITGWSSISSGATHAAKWGSYISTPLDFGTLAGGTNSYGTGINDSGQIVGHSEVP